MRTSTDSSPLFPIATGLAFMAFVVLGVDRWVWLGCAATVTGIVVSAVADRVAERRGRAGRRIRPNPPG